MMHGPINIRCVVSLNRADFQSLNCLKLAVCLLQRRKTVTNAEYRYDKKHINTLCVQNSAFRAVPASGTYNYYCSLKGD